MLVGEELDDAAGRGDRERQRVGMSIAAMTGYLLVSHMVRHDRAVGGLGQGIALGVDLEDSRGRG